MRVSLAPDLHINAFNGATITEYDSGITNGIVEKRGDILYTTQRPSIDVFEDASVNVSDARGRAVYHWETADDLYFLNNDTIYKNSHASVVSTAPTVGTKKCTFLEAGVYLVLLDAENGEAWTITTGDTVAAISDGDFPSTLTYGGAALDKYLFVMDEDGLIYNSTVNNPTTWAALDYLTAEREKDKGEYLGKHHDNVVAYMGRSIEFFYDAANSAGSPLNRRQDVSYRIGCTSGESVWEEGDRSFFVGTDFSGSLKVFTLENFAIRKVSTSTIDSLLTQAITKNSYYVNGSGFSASGHTFYILNLYLTPSDSEPTTTLVYDDTTGLWGDWETTVNGLTKFPLMAWTTRNGTQSRSGEGILFNGDLITINDNFEPQDTILASTYVTTGYVQTGYFLESGEVGTAINLKIRTGQSDGGDDVTKAMPNIRHVGDKTTTSQDLTIRWAKENNSSFSSGVTIDTSKFKRINRIGKFRRINFELDYSGTEALRLEALEGNPRIGTN